MLFFLTMVVCSFLTALDLFNYLVTGQSFMARITRLWVEIITVGVAPIWFLLQFDIGKANSCCGANGIFAAEHRTTIYLLIFLCQASYFYSSWRVRLAAPLVELLVNCMLLIGIVLNVFLCIHLNVEPSMWMIGNVPVICLFLSEALRNNSLFQERLGAWAKDSDTLSSRAAGFLLRLHWLAKIPFLAIICLPLSLIISSLLYLFGQQPDAAIRAFTETYRHGLSQLDHLCENVQCGGHYLCSIAANGHRTIVRPERYGVRNNRRIICNRQLLISNAFEELIEQRVPALHKLIRKHYDRIGDLVHRDYKHFQNKYLSDCFYILMKPLEWLFLTVLYMTDKHPENRIAQQYLDHRERIVIKQQLIGNYQLLNHGK